MKKIIILSLLFISFTSQATRIDLNYDPGDFQEPFISEIRGCDPQEMVKVREAEKNVSLRIDQLLRDWLLVDLMGVKRQFVDVENRQWVEGGPRNQSYHTYWQEMGTNLRLMNEKADRGLNFQCQSASDRQCKEGAIAYVMVIFGIPRQMIYLCPEFFTDGSFETTIFHELSHYAAKTQDYGLDWWNVEKSDLKRGVKDAYHVEEFARKEVQEVLKKSIWMWWWPKIKP